MSLPPSGAPQTPDRKSSSSTLFTAFRNLTSGRIKPPNLSSPATSAPVQAISVGRESGARPHADAPISQAEGGWSGQLPRPDQDGQGLLEPIGGAGDVFGGPPELTKLVEQLEETHPLSERAAAVHKLCPLLQVYPVNNVLKLWTTASDLLGQEDSSDASYAGYTLLKSCVQLPDLSPAERTVFFKAIARGRTSKDFHLRLQALIELTNGGRNLDAFESSVAPLLTSFLDICFKAVQDARRRNKKGRATGPLQEDEDLARLFQYILDVTRFNSKIFRDVDLELLLDQIIGICKGATRETDIINCLNIFDAIITYAHVPSKSLRRCLEVLCDIHRQLANLQGQTWRALSNLFQSHMGHSSISTLLSILTDYPKDPNYGRSSVRGAVYTLQRLVLGDGAEGLPKVSFSLLFPALKAATRVDHPKLRTDVIRLTAVICTEPNLVSLLLEEDDWNDLVDIIGTCSQNGHGKPVESTTTSSNGDEKPTTLPESDAEKASDALTEAISGLNSLIDRMDPVQKASVMELFLRLGNRLSDGPAESLVKYYSHERLLHPSNEDWIDTCQTLIDKLFNDHSRPRSLRLLVIETLKDTYHTIECIYPTESVLRCANFILENIAEERDTAVLEELLDFAVNVADWASDEVFDRVVELFRTAMDEQRGPPPPPPSSLAYWESAAVRAKEGAAWRSASNVITRALVRMFMRNLNRSARKTRVLFEFILSIAQTEDCETDARISALKLLFRLRSDANHAIFVNPSSDGENIAAVLCRTVDTAVNPEKTEEIHAMDQPKYDEQTPIREKRLSSGGSPHASGTRYGRGSANSRVSKPIRPLWMYPGPRGLPEEPSNVASHLAYSYMEATDYFGGLDRTILQMNLWLELVISLLQKGADWEVYSYVLVHFGGQLSNKSLFHGAVPQLKMLRSVLCEQVRASSFHEPPGYTSLKKADVAVCIFHILTMMISYNAHFEKSEEDDLVRSFLLGIGSWDRTSKWCIHAVTVCCHELPLSTSKTLDNMIHKMSQIITQPQIAIHILEFLASLARLPALYKNFREEEFKMVFGVCFRYLQYVRDQRERAHSSDPPRPPHGSLRRSGPSREFTPLFEPAQKPKDKSAGDDLPQYVYALAYHVITFWFMAMKLEDRQKHMAWITKNLIHTDRSGREIIEEQAEVTIDMMKRVAWTDRDETAPDPNFATPADGEVAKKTWIVGQSLLTIETGARTGLSQVTVRRASGTRYITLRPLLTLPPRHQAPITTGLAAEAFYTAAYVGILPDDIFQTFYAPLSFPGVSGLLREEPVVLPEDDMTRRAISSFDRNPTVDGHRIGVIYIGDGQTSEDQILCNVMGTSDYTNFISGLGTLTRLKGAKFNAGGLDCEFDTDGEFTVCWRDRVTEIVFHITTLMPTDPNDQQMSRIAKKRLIGNDHVNIIFNDSGLPYRFDTFPSAFNYVFIVITPEARASFVESRLDLDPEGATRFYKVQVMSKPGFPEISPAAEMKIISGKHLAAYVRLIALNASVFSLVWQAREIGESISSWRNRLREIKRLRERYCDANFPHPSSPNLQQHGGPGGYSHGSVGSASQAFSPPARESITGGTLFKRTSVTTFISEGTSRSSIAGPSSTDMERQGSDASRG